MRQIDPSIRGNVRVLFCVHENRCSDGASCNAGLGPVYALDSLKNERLVQDVPTVRGPQCRFLPECLHEDNILRFFTTAAYYSGACLL